MNTMGLLTSTSIIEFSNVTFNDTTTTTTTTERTFTMPVGIRILTLTSMILIDISAFLGNLLVICAFFRTRRLQTVTNYFIASLAFADALVAIFVLPLSIYCYQRDRSWKLGLVLCDLWVSSDVLLCTSSILNLTCISVDRYMAITKPLTYTAYRSKFLARIMILLVWIVSAVITCPPIFGWRDQNRRYTVEQEHTCDLNTARGYVVYSALGSFYIPGVVMIFVYIRIFMVVYDRENLIKKFHTYHSSTTSIKSIPNGVINHTDLSNNKKKFQKKLSSCCCLCFQKQNQSLKPSIPRNLFSNCPAIEQKQNGYLIYRFTNNNRENNNNNSNTNSSSQTPPSSSKSSIFCRPCRNSTKKMSNISDEIYQYRRNYLAHIAAEYQFRTDDSPCYELKTLEDSISPLTKCRSRSFEQSTTNKIRDLNTELSHSRQLKAAAVAAAAAAGSTTTTSTKDSLKQQNDLDDLILSHKETDSTSLFPTANGSLHQATQSLHELTQLSITQNIRKYKRNHSQQSNPLPMRSRATTNPALIQLNLQNSPTYPHLMPHKRSIPEPTRINRRMKSSRSIATSPSALLIENFKQQHRITRNGSIKSNQSSKSLASIRHFNYPNENLKENNHSWCCCCCLSLFTKPSQNKSKQIFTYTPNHSVTHDDDDDDKISSNDTSNRTPLYTPAHSSSIQRTSTGSSSTPGDVHRRERIRFMKEQKTAKTLAVVVGGFIILWLPFFIMYVIPPEKYPINMHTATLITWLGYFNSVINPFIYAYCSKQFRMAFWNITFGICMKKSIVLAPISNKNKQLHQRRIN